MSWSEQESLPEIENPDPEEDLDLPRRQEQEVEGPEDDLGLPQSNSDSQANAPVAISTPELVTEDSSIPNVADIASGGLGHDADASGVIESNATVGVVIGQDGYENKGGPESSSGVTLESHSEANNKNSRNNDCGQDVVLDRTNVTCDIVTGVPGFTPDHESATQALSEHFQPPHGMDITFSSNIAVSNNIEDAPEAEIAGLQIDSCQGLPATEDNAGQPVPQHVSTVSHDLAVAAVSCPSECEKVRGENNIFGDDGDELAANDVTNMLAPECDRRETSTVNTPDVSHLPSSWDHISTDKDSTSCAHVHISVTNQVMGNETSFQIASDIPFVEDIYSNAVNSNPSPHKTQGKESFQNSVTATSAKIEENSSISKCDNSTTSHADDADTASSAVHLDVDSPHMTLSYRDQILPDGKVAAVTLQNLGASQQRQVFSTLSGSASHHSSPSMSELGEALHKDDCSSFQRKLAMALESEDDEDDLLHELDAELLAKPRNRSPLSKPPDPGVPVKCLNGLQAFDVRQLQAHNRQLLEQLTIRDEEILRLREENATHKQELAAMSSQLHKHKSADHTGIGANADDLYLPQIKELEKTIAQQEHELKSLKEKLVSHDNGAKKTILSLQNELKSRVDQVTKMYEECRKEKDTIVVRYAESEAKYMDVRRLLEKSEAKAREAVKEKDSMVAAVKTAKADKQRLVVSFESKCTEVSNLNKEIEKLKEAVSSSEFRIKWFQNKLKDELEQHKETKAALEKTTVKLKEAREETEIIRQECQAIVKRYQECEEIKSNSLDKELKQKETELRTQMQEKNDTEEIHQMTKKELDSLKMQHKDVLEELKTLKDKVQCLEVERQQNHLMIENYQEIMQRQKTENATLKAKITALSTLEDDFKRAQEMILCLDKDITEMKVANKDLQKDMDACSERESKLLALQSELSRTNALTKSENTNLTNKTSLLTSELEKWKTEAQELKDMVKILTAKYEEEKAKRESETEKLNLLLTEKTKECNDFKQKWEDELDSSKTLKRRHANNIKDLTRQLQQVKKKLESMEGKGDAGSMGSRTNSNGSLNSIDNVPHPQAQPQETVITEQVEVDKQVLIERIVRLQKAHARKNEKLEFLGEHIQQLLEEIKKKNKIIQSYVLREEAGTLSSEEMDTNKMEVHKEIQTLLARKGGIMASVYSVHQQDGAMTLDLSLQINRKLQAVLEDTLLKNITLKENLDTLGEEIARLSQENRRLQLSLQDMQQRLQQVQA